MTAAKKTAAALAKFNRLGRKMEAHNNAIQRLEAIRERAWLAYVSLKFGIRIGDVVAATVTPAVLHGKPRDGEFIITDISSRYGQDKPWVSGKRIKKDGSTAKLSTNLYEGWSKKP